MSEKPKIVSKVPEITPALLDKNEEQQRTWRDIYTLPHPSARSYAHTVIKDNLAALDRLEDALKSAKHGEKGNIRKKIGFLRHDTAIWFSSVGDYEAAAQLTICKHQRKLFKLQAAAVVRPDDEWCGHPFFEETPDGLSQVAYREHDVFSHKHGRSVAMMRCSKCGFRNARELPAELQSLSEHRAAAVASGKDKKVDLAEVVR